jgi:Transposase
MTKPGLEADTFRRIEVITGVGRRRRWTEDRKTAIVAETLEEGAVVSAVARRHGVAPSFRPGGPWKKKRKIGGITYYLDAALADDYAVSAPALRLEPMIKKGRRPKKHRSVGARKRAVVVPVDPMEFALEDYDRAQARRRTISALLGGSMSPRIAKSRYIHFGGSPDVFRIIARDLEGKREDGDEHFEASGDLVRGRE